MRESVLFLLLMQHLNIGASSSLHARAVDGDDGLDADNRKVIDISYLCEDKAVIEVSVDSDIAYR